MLLDYEEKTESVIKKSIPYIIGGSQDLRNYLCDKIQILVNGVQSGNEWEFIKKDIEQKMAENNRNEDIIRFQRRTETTSNSLLEDLRERISVIEAEVFKNKNEKIVVAKHTKSKIETEQEQELAKIKVVKANEKKVYDDTFNYLKKDEVFSAFVDYAKLNGLKGYPKNIAVFVKQSGLDIVYNNSFDETKLQQACEQFNQNYKQKKHWPQTSVNEWFRFSGLQWYLSAKNDEEIIIGKRKKSEKEDEKVTYETWKLERTADSNLPG
jgi:hypothetical protein